MADNTRIYLVVGPKGPRLVDATSKAVARSHCAQTDYTVTVASQRDLVTHRTLEVEDAGAAPAVPASDPAEPASGGVIDGQFREVGETVAPAAAKK